MSQRTSRRTTTICGTIMIQQASRTGPFDAELHRQGADAEFLVAFDGLEVVQRHDPVGAQAVQDGKDQDARVRQAGRHDRRPREPGKAFIAESAGGITEPAVLFQSERGGGE